MYHKLILLIIFGQVEIVRSGNISYIDEQEDDVGTCLVNILASRSQLGADLVVIDSDEVTAGLLRRLHLTGNLKLHVKHYNTSVDTSPQIYIIHVQDLYVFKTAVEHLDRDWNRKPESLYIIVLKDMSDKDFLLIFQTLWEYHILHVLVITDRLGENALIFTYFPYAEGRCGRDYTNTVEVCSCASANVTDVIQVVRAINKPVLTNCTLQVATYFAPPMVLPDIHPEQPFVVGVERFLLEILVKKENISLNYTFFPQTYEHGNIADNFTVTGLLSKLYNNEVDLVFGSFALNNRRAAFFDYIVHLPFEDSFVAVCPDAGLERRWKMVYIVFQPVVWGMAMMAIVICATLLIDYNHLKRSGMNDNCLVLLNLFGSATENRVLVLTVSTYKNILIVHWLWYIFLLNSFYQTRLTSYSTYRPHAPQIDKYTALQNYNFTPCFTSDISRFLKNSGNLYIINEEYLELVGCETGERALNQVAAAQTKYTITKYLKYLWWATHHPRDKDKLHLVEDTVFNALYCLFFKRGFPLLKDLKKRVHRFADHGFVDASRTFHRIPQSQGRHSATSNSGSFEIRVLKLTNLTIPFVILVSGIIFSGITFLIEISRGNK